MFEQQTIEPTLASSRTRTKPVILCVDDERVILDELWQQLNSYLGDRFSIELAESGDEALEVIDTMLQSQKEIAVIISDQLMPGMKGDELLIEAHKKHPQALKIMLTGQANQDDVGNAVNYASLYRYIPKPWENTDMRLTIEEAAKRYLSDRKLAEQNNMLESLHRATQAIAKNLELPGMSEELMRILLEFSQAERAMLVLNNDGVFHLEAVADRSDPQQEAAMQVGLNMPLNGSGDYPTALLERVKNDQAPLILEDASQSKEFSNDPYVKQNDVHAAMVLPVLNLGKLVGAMYLENRRIKREFPEKQVEVLRMLANDAAIAIENARMYQQLEEMVERRTEKLRESYSELMAVNSHKDKIIQIVSHDIRSPLSAVAEMASTLQDEDVSQDPETVVKNAGIIQRSVKTTLNMVNDILDLAKLESGKVILNYSKVNLKDFLKQAAQMQDPQIQQKNINLQMNPGEDCRISVDPSKMTQALGNLLSNAIKFTPSGGDVIMGYDLADYDGQQYARIQVADTGMGMSQEQLTTLFEKFNKTQRKGTRGEKGTGLGLSIAKEIIELHHGEIHVESDEGIGTTFTVLLPLEPPQQDGQANASGA